MRGLEDLLRKTGRFLASTISAAALYASAQEPTKIPVDENGNWNKPAEATLYFQSTTGSQGRDLTKNTINQFQTPIYFSGRRNSNNNIEFFYATTDWNKPIKNPPVPDNVHSKLYLIADSDTTAEIISQKIAILNSKGEVAFEEATPKEKASSTLMKISLDMVEAIDEGIKKYVEYKTAGFLKISIQDIATDYCESKTKKGASNAKNNTGYELTVNNLPLWARDNNLAFRNKEVGRITELKIKSSKGDKVPVSIYYSLSLKRETEQEKGKIEAYTELFTTPARKLETQTYPTSNNTNRNTFEGLWFRTNFKGQIENPSAVVITDQGLVYPVTLTREFPTGKYVVYKIGEKTKEEIIGWEVSRKEINEGKFEKPVVNFGRIRPFLSTPDECIELVVDGRTTHYTSIKEQGQKYIHPEWMDDPIAKEIRENSEAVYAKEPKQSAEKPKPAPPKQTTGPSYDIRNWLKK